MYWNICAPQVPTVKVTGPADLGASCTFGNLFTWCVFMGVRLAVLCQYHVYANSNMQALSPCMWMEQTYA